MKKLKYNLGDRVVALKDQDGAKKGDRGKVIGSYLSDITKTNHFCVEFDRFINGHDGNNRRGVKGKQGHCWWFYDNSKVEEAFKIVNAQKIVITSDGVETLARLYDGGKVVKSATAKCSPDDTFVFEEGARIALHRMLGDYAEVKAEKPLKFEVGKRYIGSNVDGDRLVIEITRQTCDMNTINHITYYEYKVVEGKDCGSHRFGEGSNFEKRLKPYDPPKYYNGKVVCIKEGIDITVGKVYEFVDGKLIDDRGEDRPCPNDPTIRTKNLDEGWARGKFTPLVE